MVVVYKGVPETVRSLCEALLANGSAVVVVDNTDDPAVPAIELPDSVTVIGMGRNAGVAEGFNAGIRRSIESGAECVVLFDQDSDPADGFIGTLVAHLDPERPGVAAPVARDRSTGREYPSRRIGSMGRSVNVFAGAEKNDERVPVDIVISSGTAITTPAFSLAGMMDESFFIDFVDVEWCLRARACGVPIHIVPGAVMEHSIGDAMVRAPLGLYRGLLHSPFRTYYKIRNSFLLFRKPHTPFLFGAHQILSALVHHAIQLLFVSQRRAYLRSYVRGVYHGVTGVTGYQRAN